MNKAGKFIAAAALLAGGYGVNVLEHRLAPASLASANAVHVFGRVTEEEAKAGSAQLHGNPRVPASALFSGADFGTLYLLAFVTLAVALYRLMHRSSRLTPLAVLPVARAAVRMSRSLERTVAFRDNSEKRIIPRNLLRNPYGPGTSHLPFEGRVQIAIEASLRESRVIGVICVRVHSFHQIGSAESQVPGESNLEVLAAFFRTRLRSTDCVRITSPEEIMVFISLLNTLENLRSIAGRLAAASIDGKHLPDWQVSVATGTAMYPIDGYTGGELIVSARKRLPRNASILRADPAPLLAMAWQQGLLSADSHQ